MDYDNDIGFGCEFLASGLPLTPSPVAKSFQLSIRLCRDCQAGLLHRPGR
jgi:hypothetical protein